jgi:hypothetical protein
MSGERFGIEVWGANFPPVVVDRNRKNDQVVFRADGPDTDPRNHRQASEVCAALNAFEAENPATTDTPDKEGTA